ncbi:MAG: BlaI/MecI/CopY family transcriptional regulator [Roseburia inulinivorans]
MNAKQLTAAETIVMKCIWDADHEMSLAEIVKNANEGYGKEWKPQTVSTYLAKLCLYQKLYPDETCWKNHYL